MEIKEGRVDKVNAGCLSSLCACYSFILLYSPEELVWLYFWLDTDYIHYLARALPGTLGK
jgi:hypothetical protein